MCETSETCEHNEINELSESSEPSEPRHSYLMCSSIATLLKFKSMADDMLPSAGVWIG